MKDGLQSKKKFVKKRPNRNLIRYKQYHKLWLMDIERDDLREKADFYLRKFLRLPFDDLAI